MNKFNMEAAKRDEIHKGVRDLRTFFCTAEVPWDAIARASAVRTCATGPLLRLGQQHRLGHAASVRLVLLGDIEIYWLKRLKQQMLKQLAGQTWKDNSRRVTTMGHHAPGSPAGRGCAHSLPCVLLSQRWVTLVGGHSFPTRSWVVKRWSLI